MISNLSEDELRVHLASGTGWIPLLGTADTVSKTISASLNTLSIYGLKTIPAGGGSSGNGDATLAWLQSNVFGSVCSQCHIGAAVPMGVDWSSETASCANVGRSSGEVPALMEVASGNALASYVIWKVAGAGPNDRRSSARPVR